MVEIMAKVPPEERTPYVVVAFQGDGAHEHAHQRDAKNPEGAGPRAQGKISVHRHLRARLHRASAPTLR